MSRAGPRVERGIYRQANGNYAVYAQSGGLLRFHAVGTDLIAARAHVRH
jgi:hypothetical protein